MNQKKSDEKIDKPTHCLNCGTPLAGDFCRHCGQKNKFFLLTFRQLISEFLSDYLTFDSKFFRSLKPLLFKPGFLTNEYNAGKRVRYISPLKMYLFISVIFFFLVATNRHKDSFVEYSPDTAAVSDSTTTADSSKSISGAQKKAPITVKQKPKNRQILKSDTLANEQNRTDQKKQSQPKISGEKKKEFQNYFFNFLPKMFFFLLPVFALLLKLLYVRRKIYYTEHFIFSLHFHSFLFLVTSLMLLISNFIENVRTSKLPIAAPLLIGVYLFFAMKNVYRQSIKKTMVKFILLSFIHLIVFSISTLLVVWLAIYLIKI